MKKQLILFVFATFLLFITKVNAQQADSAAMQKTQQHIEGNLKDANKHQNKIDKSQKRIEKQQRRINRQERKRDKKMNRVEGEQKKLSNAATNNQ